jgi:DNA-directed RNA polymerase subunit M/transcription elongation factor TFIIS
MGFMKLRMIDGAKALELNLQQINGANVQSVIEGVFGFFNTKVNNYARNHRWGNEEADMQSYPLIEVKRGQELVPEVKPEEKRYFTAAAKQKLNEVFKHSFDLPAETDEEGEEFQYVLDKYVKTYDPNDESIPFHFKTGYKIKADDHGNRIKLYRTRYICPKCKNKGNHYVPEGTDFVDCHNCQTTMPVKKAVAGHTLTPDALLNWYIAGEQKRIKVVTEEHYEKLKKRAIHA